MRNQLISAHAANLETLRNRACLPLELRSDGCYRAAKGSNFLGWVPFQYLGVRSIHADFAF